MYMFVDCDLSLRRLRLLNDNSPNSEFTFTAVLLGLLIGCLLCFTNLYFGLQTGFISMYYSRFLIRYAHG